MRALLLVLFVLCALAGLPYLLMRLSRRYGTDGLVIPPLSRARYVYLNADEGLAQRTQKKRQAAAVIRHRAAQVDSGSVFSDLRAVK